MTLAPKVEVRRLLRSRRFGVLATQSRRFDGYPFGSVVPYMVAHDGTLVILISRLAEHTRNVAADAKVSLTVFERGCDVQAESRVSVVGNCTRTAADDGMCSRYLRLHPNASRYLQLDFHFHRIEPVAARHIGGFGTVQWVNRGLVVAADEIACAEESLLLRIDREHGPELSALCARMTGRVPDRAHVAAVDCDGLDVRADDELFRIDFPEPQFRADAILPSIAAALEGAGH